MSESTKHHYTNKKRLTAELTAYGREKRKAKIDGTPLPQLNDFLAVSIMDICRNVGFMWNFIAYTYKEEMIGDAIENVVRYCHNFNPDKYKDPKNPPNAFAYITQIAKFAFIRRIKKEKRLHLKQLLYIRDSIDVEEVLGEIGMVEKSNAVYYQEYTEYLRQTLDTLDVEELRLEEPKPKKAEKPGFLEQFMED